MKESSPVFKSYLQKKIRKNIDEWKRGRWVSREQALAVSYHQARDYMKSHRTRNNLSKSRRSRPHKSRRSRPHKSRRSRPHKSRRSRTHKSRRSRTHKNPRRSYKK